MAQWAKQWTYLFLILWAKVRNRNNYIFCVFYMKYILLYICINKSTLYFQYNFKFKIFQYGLMFVIYKFSSLPQIFLIIDIEGQYLKNAFYKHMSQK